MQRQDSWQNVAMGFGTSRDKTQGTNFSGPCIPLTDQECADLFGFDDIAGKICSALPKEAFREGFNLNGLPPEQVETAAEYLERFQLAQQCKNDAIWARVFGGCATWIHADDGKRPEEPLDLTAIRTIWKLVTCDKRFLVPYRYYTEGPKVAEPELYMLYMPTAQNVLQVAGLIHESRLVIWPGDMTEQRAKIQRNSWDYSVLQKPYDALRSSGNTWKAIEILTTDANQAVYKIKNLWRMIAADPTQGEDSKTGNGTPSGGLLLRLRFMDLARSVSKAIVLDADGEDFERKATSFSGLADLSDRAWNRVAAAADMPVTILTGQAPAGLNATGASDLRWWYGRVASEQVQTYEPRIKRLLQVLLCAQDSGVQLDEKSLKAVTVGWKPLWAPSAVELQAMQLQWAQTGQIMIQEQMITPEEYVCSAPEDWFSALDRDQRQNMVEELDVQGEKDEAAAAEADAQAAQTEALRAKAGGSSNSPKDRKDGDPDQPRDETGKWTDGGGGSSVGGGGRARLSAVAQTRLQKAKETHEKAKAEHETAKAALEQAKGEASKILDQRLEDRQAAAARATELADRVKAQIAANKRTIERLQAGVVARDEAEGDREHTAEDTEFYEAQNENEERLPEHLAELRREARENGPLRPKEAARLQALREAIAKGDASYLDDKGDVDVSLHTNEAAIEYLTEERARSWMRENGKTGINPKRREAFRENIEKEVEPPVRALEAGAGFEVLPSKLNPGSWQGPAKGTSFTEKATAAEKAAKRAERTARSVKLHEREVKRRGNAKDRDGDGRTGEAELRDDK